MYRLPYQFTFADIEEDTVDLTVDPIRGQQAGPPSFVEIIGAGSMVFRCVSDPDNDRTWTLLSSGASYDGSIGLTTIIKAGTTITGLRVRW